MQRFFDSPLGNLLRVLGELMLVNLLCILLSIPVLTLGASVSGMYAVLMKMVRGETIAVTRTFFKNFKDNFLKATAIWLGFLVIAFIAYVDVKFALTFEGTTRTLYIILATVIVLCGTIVMTLGITQMSRYENTLKNYIKNSFLLAACAPGWLILALAVWVVLVAAIVLLRDYIVTYGFVLLMWGVSAPALATAYFVNKIFEKVENAQADQ